MNINNSQLSLNILVVEESPDIAQMLRRVLFAIGHSVTIFNKQSEAIEELEKNSDYDVIITDDFLREKTVIPENELTGAVLVNTLLSNKKLPIAVWGVYVSELKKYFIDNKKIAFFKKPHNTLGDILAWLGEIKKTENSQTDAFPIFQLIYASKAKENFSEDDLINILNTARQFNKAANISGALIYHNHYFLQVLEGEQQAVLNLYNNRISKDKRHKEAVVFNQEVVDKRVFQNWDMGFFGSGDNEDYVLLGLTDFDKHPAGQFFKNKLTDSQKKLLGISC